MSSKETKYECVICQRRFIKLSNFLAHRSRHKLKINNRTVASSYGRKGIKCLGTVADKKRHCMTFVFTAHFKEYLLMSIKVNFIITEDF